jgi:two-component system sensor histidine kinase RegB
MDNASTIKANIIRTQNKDSALLNISDCRLSDMEILETKSKINLLLKLRFWALAGQCAVIWPALQMKWLERADLAPYGLVVASFVILTILSKYAIKYHVIKATQSFVFFQLALDSLALSMLLKLTGGPWNPFAPLLLFHAALGAILLRGAWLTYFVLFIVWCLILMHLSPSIPSALSVQPTPSVVLFPAQSLVLLFFVGLLIWVSSQLEEQKKTLARMREEKDHIDRLRAFGVIATGFSHEFATPLATLRLKLRRLKNKESLECDPDLEVAIEAASQAERSLKSLMHQKFLPAETDFSPLEVASSIENILQTWSHEKEFVELISSLQRGWVKAPPVSFTQMIIDVLDNACRANKETGKQHISVNMTSTPSKIELSFSDQGPGFPAWMLDHIGEPFFSTHSQGSGLGLYHAHVLCQAMGGKLKIENLAAGGAKVSLSWAPLKQSPNL